MMSMLRFPLLSALLVAAAAVPSACVDGSAPSASFQSIEDVGQASLFVAEGEEEEPASECSLDPADGYSRCDGTTEYEAEYVISAPLDTGIVNDGTGEAFQRAGFKCAQYAVTHLLPSSEQDAVHCGTCPEGTDGCLPFFTRWFTLSVEEGETYLCGLPWGVVKFNYACSRCVIGDCGE